MWQIRGNRMREKALRGGEARGHPATATTAKKLGREKGQITAGELQEVARQDRKASSLLIIAQKQVVHCW